MKEYIERDAAIKSITSAFDEVLSVGEAIDTLDAIPAADVVEVKHGRWIYNNMGGWKCSECNNQAPFWCMASTQNLSDYCPNCGAKMTEDRHEQKE